MTVAAALQYQALYNRLRLLTATTIERLWDTHGGLTDVEQATFTKLASTTVLGASAATARLVASYIAHEANTRPVSIDFGALRTLRGVDIAEVFARPTVTARTAISDGKSFVEAMQAGRIRASTLASTDVMLTQRHATVEVLGQTPHAVGYRRTLTGNSCNLCATASTQRYHIAQLAPIHDHCDCGVAPIIGTKDPGHIINTGLLEELKARRAAGDAAASRTISAADVRIAELKAKRVSDPGAALQIERTITVLEQRKVRALIPPDDEVALHVHGELGPVLTVKGDHFDGPSVVN